MYFNKENHFSLFNYIVSSFYRIWETCMKGILLHSLLVENKLIVPEIMLEIGILEVNYKQVKSIFEKLIGTITVFPSKQWIIDYSFI